jgi:hypothetical protein
LFWIFWAISIPITVVLVVLWQWYVYPGAWWSSLCFHTFLCLPDWHSGMLTSDRWYRKTEKRLVEAPAPLQRSDTGLTDVSRATVWGCLCWFRCAMVFWQVAARGGWT